MLVQTCLWASLGVIIRQWFMCGSPMFGAFPFQSRVHFSSYIPLKKKEKVNYASTAPSRRCSFFLVVAHVFTERLQPVNAHLWVVTLILGLATTIYTINIKEMLHHIHNLTSFHSVGSVRTTDTSSPLRGNSTLNRFTERAPNKMLRSIIETSSLSDTTTNRHYHPLLFLSSAAPILRCGTLQH